MQESLSRDRDRGEGTANEKRSLFWERKTPSYCVYI